MKHLLLIFFSLSVVFFDLNAQCTNVPVQEAVRNGDFEAGYLPGAVGKNHSFTTGSNLDFYSDLDFLGPKPNYPTAGCSWGIGDKYAVAKAENFSCTGSTFTNNTPWAVGYGGAKDFNDHTPGQAGKGYALLADLNTRTVSPKTGGLPIAWEQKVDVYPSQNYWFSAWVANFGGAGGTAPIMQVVVIPEKSGVVDVANKVTLPVTTTVAGTMVWTQMSAKWTPVGIYDKVTIRFEFVNVAGGASGLDLAIDDISFINSCQNLATGNAYTANFNLPDTVNLCSQVGAGITLDPNVPAGQKGNASVYWFSGASPQTQFATGVWTQTVSSVGTYRVCIDDPDNNCSINDNVVVIEKASLNIPDVELCSPSQVTLDCGITFPTIGISSVNWSGPSGAASAKTYTVTKGGNHSVTINSAAGHNCSATDNFTVTSKLPAAPTNLDYCDGGGTAVALTVGDGKSYKWSTSPTMTPVIGAGTSVAWTPSMGTSGDQTLWIQDATITAIAGTGGPTAGNLTSWPSGQKALNFTTTQVLQLNSFVVRSAAWNAGCAAVGTTISVTFTITGSANLSHTQVVNCGANTTITPNWNLPAGSYTLNASIAFQFAGSVGTTNIGGGKATITSTGATMFADLTFSISEACDPIPVVIKAKSCCAKPNDNPEIDYAASSLTVCAPNTATVITKALTNGLAYQWQVSHNKGVNWKDTLAAGVVAGAKATLNNVSASAWYRIVIATAGNLSTCFKNSDSAVVVINPLPTAISVTVNPNKTSFCKGEAHTLTASATPSGSTFQWKYAGTGTNATINGLTTVGTHNYKVVATLNGCVDSSAMKTITINALPDSTINPLSSYCGDVSTPVNLTAVTAGGSWKVDNVALGGSSFVPKNYSTGTHIVEYDVTANGCSSDDTVQFHIIKKDTADITAAGPFCKNAAAVTLKAVNTGGTWSGTGITSGTLGTFNPKNAAVGPNTITYTITGTCGDTKTTSITVNATDSAKINTVGAMCSSSPAITLNTYLTAGSTPGGTWSGTGITNTSTGAFDPSSLAQNTYQVKYTTGGACPTADSVNISITNGVNLSFLNTQKAIYCQNGSIDTIKVNQLLSGGIFSTFSGKGITDATNGYYDPKLADVGVDTVYYSKSGLCGDTIKFVIEVKTPDVAKIQIGQGPFCVNDPAQLIHLDPSSTTGGLWGGVMTNPASALFDPFSAMVGWHRVSYNTQGACPAVDTITIRVVEQMQADITEKTIVKCKNASVFSVPLSVNSALGGVWLSIPAGKVDNSGTVDPATAGEGTFKVYYAVQSLASSCGALDSVDISITSIDTAKITLGQGPFCLNDPALTLAKEAASSAGVWSGTGITSGAAGTFNPTTAGVGSHKITYTTSGACPVFDTLTIGVVNQMVANITTADNTNICVDNGLYQVALSGNSTAGGTWSSVPAGLVNASGKFNPQLAGVASGIKVLYSVSGATATCSAKDSVLLNVLPREEAQITDGATKSFCTYDAAFQFTPLNPGGTWAGTGVTSGGLFTPSAAGAGGPYAIRYKVNGTSGLCSDEDTIMVTVIAPTNAAINAAGPFCQNLGLQTLSPVVPGGTFSGTGVSAGGVFNPAAAGPGTYWIKYTQGGLCPNSDSIQITVDALPQVIITPDVVGGCVPLVVNFGDSSTSASQIATWTFGDGASKTVLSSNASTSHTYTKVGSFDIWLKMQFANGCKDSSQSKVTVTEVPVADFTFGPQPASTLDPTVNFTNQSTGATNYQWKFTTKGTPTTSTNTDEIVVFDPTDAEAQGLDTVQVTLKASNAVCTDSIVKNVLIKDIFTLYTPNAFTPNGDGLNDQFYPDGLNHVCDNCKNYEFMIFNRWGEMIYRTTNAGDKWNGKRDNNLRDAEIDVYVWKVIYTDSFTGKEGKQMGAVTLIR